MAHEVDAQPRTEALHAPRAAVVRQNGDGDARCRQCGEPHAHRVVRLADGLGRERIVEVGEQQRHAMRAQEVRRHGGIIVKNPMRCQEHRHGFLSGCISILVVYQFFPFSARGYRLCLSFSRSRRRRPQAAAATVCRSSTSPTLSATAGGCCAASCRAERRAACSVSPTAAMVLCRSCSCSAAPSSASACAPLRRRARGL